MASDLVSPTAPSVGGDGCGDCGCCGDGVRRGGGGGDTILRLCLLKKKRLAPLEFVRRRECAVVTSAELSDNSAMFSARWSSSSEWLLKVGRISGSTKRLLGTSSTILDREDVRTRLKPSLSETPVLFNPLGFSFALHCCVPCRFSFCVGAHVSKEVNITIFGTNVSPQAFLLIFTMLSMLGVF